MKLLPSLLMAVLFVASMPMLGQVPGAVPVDVLKQYRIALLKQASHMNYPKDALELGIEGTAVVRLSIDAGGRLNSSTIDPSSGYAALDLAALEMVRKAHPLVTLPPALRGRSFDVAVPVIFRMREEREKKP